MLKKLFQLFAKSFLKSKKGWISEQSFPKEGVNEKIIIGEAHMYWLHYTAPSNGWVFICMDDASKVKNGNIYTDDGLYSSAVGQDWIRVYVPIRKGQKANCYGETTDSSKVTFAFRPSVGSV